MRGSETIMRLAAELRTKVAQGGVALGTFLVEMQTPGAPIILQRSGMSFFMVVERPGNL